MVVLNIFTHIESQNLCIEERMKNNVCGGVRAYTVNPYSRRIHNMTFNLYSDMLKTSTYWGWDGRRREKYR